MSNENPDYVEAVSEALNGMMCPACGEPARYNGWTSMGGTLMMLPIFACDTEDCPFNGREGEQTWTPASSG